jgi:CHAT domain-containing protein
MTTRRKPEPVSPDTLPERIAALSDPRAVRRFLRGRRSLATREVITRLTEAVARETVASTDRAERLSEAAGILADWLDDEFCKALAWRAAGHVLLARGRFVASLQTYDAAEAVFRKHDDELEVARTLSMSMGPPFYLGHNDEALARVEAAREIFTRLGDRWRLAALDNNLATLYSRQDRREEALALYQRAYETMVELGETQGVAVALRNLAMAYVMLNRFAEALDAHERAREVCAAQGLSLMVAQADYNIAYLYYMRGEYTRAMELYRDARHRSQELGDAYHQALCDLDESELYLELNLVEEGTQLARQAYAGFSKLEIGYETAKALANLAIGLGRQGEPFKALELFEKAREIFVREDNRVWPALIDVFRAVVLHQEGRSFEARRFAEAALRFFAGTELASKAALCELLLARIHLQTGELRSARERCLSALERLEKADAPELSYRVHFLLGQVDEALGDTEAAWRSYRTAHERIENLRSHLEQDELKIGFLKDKLAVYESLVFRILAGSPGEAERELAFQYVEQAKSRVLADLLAFRAHSLPGRGSSSGPVEEVHSLRRELSWYYRRIDLAEMRRESHSAAYVEGLRRESRQREAELLRVLRDMGSREQEFASLQGQGTASLEAIRGTLPSDAVLLEYYEARGTILAVILTRKRLEIVPLTPVSRVQHLLRLLQFQLSKFRLGPEYVKTFEGALRAATATHLSELYDELVAPIRGRLDSWRLIIVPHDFLHYVPFQALFDGSRFLTDVFELTYAPSANVHHLCATKPRRDVSSSLVLGVPDAATPFIEEEARAVAGMLPGARLFVGSEANEAALRSHGPGSRFVHIATHGLFRYDNPMFSSLQLGDSRLSLFDIYQLDLAAELVTLSGCGTGLNVVEGGDELMGLVRGLLYAGAQAAVVTLWDVNDESTAEFMKLFYRRLMQGVTTAAALRETMRELRGNYPHPFYWAPFIVVGA